MSTLRATYYRLRRLKTIFIVYFSRRPPGWKVGTHSCEIGRSTVSLITTHRISEPGIHLRSRGRPSFLLVRTLGGRPCLSETKKKRYQAHPHCHPASLHLRSSLVWVGSTHSPSLGITETLQLRFLHCAPASKANFVANSTAAPEECEQCVDFHDNPVMSIPRVFATQSQITRVGGGEVPPRRFLYFVHWAQKDRHMHRSNKHPNHHSKYRHPSPVSTRI